MRSSQTPPLTFDGSEDVYVIGGKDVVEGDAADIVAGTFLWVKTVDETTAAGKVAMKTVYVLNPDDDTPHSRSPNRESQRDRFKR